MTQLSGACLQHLPTLAQQHLPTLAQQHLPMPSHLRLFCLCILTQLTIEQRFYDPSNHPGVPPGAYTHDGLTPSKRQWKCLVEGDWAASTSSVGPGITDE